MLKFKNPAPHPPSNDPRGLLVAHSLVMNKVVVFYNNRTWYVKIFGSRI